MNECQDDELGSQATADERFLHLLKPVRDMIKNWDIDLSESLRSYLQQCEELSVNFAQAGLILQGSSHIYARKVDYLLCLLYETLQSVDKEKKKKSRIKGPDGDDLNEEHVSEFMVSRLEDEDNLEMKETLSKKKTVSAKISFMPVSLIPLETQDKKDIPLISEKGEDLGSQMDYRLTHCQGDCLGVMLMSKPNYDRTNLCIPHLVSRPSTPMEEVCESQPAPSIEDNGKVSPILNNDQEENISDMGFDPIPEEISLPEARGGQARGNTAKLKAINIPHPNKPVTRASLRALEPHPINLEEPADEGTKRRFNLPSSLVVRNRKSSRKRKREEQENALGSLSSVLEEPIMPIWDFCSTYFIMGSTKSSRKHLKDPMFFKELDKDCKLRREIIKCRNKTLQSQQEAADCLDPYGEKSFDEIFDNVNRLDDGMEVNEELDDCLDMGNHSDEEICIPEKSGLDINLEKLAYEHLLRYKANLEQYRETRELDQNVNRWKEQINPFINPENEREPFDINVYSSRVLDAFGDNSRKQTVSFAQVVTNRPVGDIARYLFTSLLMTNQRNFDISTDGSVKDGLNTMDLTLLSRKRVQEEFDNYSAPSQN